MAMNYDQIEVTDVNVLTNNIVELIKTVENVDTAFIYGGELAGDLKDLNLDLSTGNATILLKWVDQQYEDSRFHNGENALIQYYIYTIAGLDQNAYNPEDRYTALICNDIISKMKKLIEKDFLGCPLIQKPKIIRTTEVRNYMVNNTNVAIYRSVLNVYIVYSVND